MSDRSSANDLASSLPASVRALLPQAGQNVNSILSDLTPQLLQHRILHSAHPSRLIDSRFNRPSTLANALVSLGRAPSRLLLPSARTSSQRTATDLAILEQVDELLALPIPSPTNLTFNSQLAIQAASQPGYAVSLLAGFQATTPASSRSRQARRRRRAHLGESHLGYSNLNLKARTDASRGLLGASLEEEDFVFVSPEARRHSMGPGTQPNTPTRAAKGRIRKSMAELNYAAEMGTQLESKEELELDIKEIEQDRRHIENEKEISNDGS